MMCGKKIMGLATMAYYRRQILASAWDTVTLGVLPLGAAGFLAWVLARSVQTAAPSQNWSLAGVLALGVVLMLAARYGLSEELAAKLAGIDPLTDGLIAQ